MTTNVGYLRRVAELTDAHVSDRHKSVPCCEQCRFVWPCDSRELLDLLAEKDAAIEEVQQDYMRRSSVLAEIILEHDALRARLASPGLHLGYAEHTPPGLTTEGDRAALAAEASK